MLHRLFSPNLYVCVIFYIFFFVLLLQHVGTEWYHIGVMNISEYGCLNIENKQNIVRLKITNHKIITNKRKVTKRDCLFNYQQVVIGSLVGFCFILLGIISFV